MGRMESGAAASNVGGSAMMHSAVGKSMIVAAAMVTCFAAAYAQDPTNSIEGYYPTQLNRGQTTTLNVAFNVGRGGGPIAVQLFEIAPPDGITVGTLKGEEAREGVIWWTAPISVAKDAAAGARRLTVVRQHGRTAPVTLLIADHALTISNLKVTSAPGDGKTVELQFTAEEQGNATLGDAPMAWFTLSCGHQPEVGVVRGKAAGSVVTASIPHPKTFKGPGAPTFGPKCNLQVRATDQANVESNTLTTSFEFK